MYFYCGLGVVDAVSLKTLHSELMVVQLRVYFSSCEARQVGHTTWLLTGGAVRLCYLPAVCP